MRLLEFLSRKANNILKNLSLNQKQGVTWLVSYTLLLDQITREHSLFEVMFCIGLIAQGHFIFLFHVFLCKSKKALMFQNSTSTSTNSHRPKLDSLFYLINRNGNNVEPKTGKIFTIPITRDASGVNSSALDTNACDMSSLRYLYKNRMKTVQHEKKKKPSQHFLASRSSLASSISFLSSKKRKLQDKLYKFRQKRKINSFKLCKANYDVSNHSPSGVIVASNDVPSRISRLHDSFKRIRSKNRKSKLIQAPLFDLSVISTNRNVYASSRSSSTIRSTTVGSLASLRLKRHNQIPPFILE